MRCTRLQGVPPRATKRCTKAVGQIQSGDSGRLEMTDRPAQHLEATVELC